MNAYHYHRPRTLEEVFELCRQEPRARLLAGGTDLLVQLRSGRAEAPPALISLRGVPELEGVTDGERLRIGAATALTDVAENALVAQRFPALIESIAALGSRQIRNVATLGGNLCNASPGADTAPPLLVHEARVELRSPSASRELALEDFFSGPGTTRIEEDEILAAVLLDTPAPGSRAVFVRKGRVAMDIATASVAVHLELDGERIVRARIAAGSVAPVPLRLRSVEALLEGCEPDVDLLQLAQVETSALIQPISDLRATADYRRKLTGVLLRRALENLLFTRVTA